MYFYEIHYFDICYFNVVRKMSNITTESGGGESAWKTLETFCAIQERFNNFARLMKHFWQKPLKLSVSYKNPLWDIFYRYILETFVKNVSLLSKIVKSFPDRTKCFQCLLSKCGYHRCYHKTQWFLHSWKVFLNHTVTSVFKELLVFSKCELIWIDHLKNISAFHLHSICTHQFHPMSMDLMFYCQSVIIYILKVPTYILNGLCISIDT